MKAFPFGPRSTLYGNGLPTGLTTPTSILLLTPLVLTSNRTGIEAGRFCLEMSLDKLTLPPLLMMLGGRTRMENGDPGTFCLANEILAVIVVFCFGGMKVTK